MTDPLNDDERQQLIAYLDGELDRAETLAVERKINTDPRIRAEADALRRTWNLLDFLPSPEPSPNFTQRTVTRIAPAPKFSVAAKLTDRRWRQRLGWAAAVFLAGGIGYGSMAVYQHQQLPPGESAADLNQLSSDLRVIEHLGVYQQAADVHFLNELDRPDLFGED